MKNKAIIFTILALILGFQVNAGVWRVNNRTILGHTVPADFTTLQAAIDGASANDTIYVEGSPTSYGNGVFDKPLVVIGAGYFLADNDTTQAYQQSSQVGQLTFNAGSEGSVMMGLYCYKAAPTSVGIICVSINTDSITLKKNRIYAHHDWSNFGSNAVTILVAAGAQDIHIMQNFIQSSVVSPAGLSYGLSIGAGAKCVVNNNIFRIVNTTGGAQRAIVTANDATNEIYINNNVFYGYDLYSFYSTYLNNIQILGTYNNSTFDYSANNLCSDEQFPLINDNQQTVDMSTVFVNYTSLVDSGFVLKPGPNAAVDSAINGGDCGAFSTDTGYPYVLSGMPEIPANFSVSFLGNTLVKDSISANVKAITHNEGK